MPSATAITQAISHYAPQLQAMGVHPVDVLLRLDAKQTPNKGDLVSWQWSGGVGNGEVRKVYSKPISRSPKGSKVKRNGSKENPALIITPTKGGTVVKLASEVKLKERSDACSCEEPKRKLKRSRLVKLLKLDARKCSPPWKGTLGSCTRGAEASSKRSIANIARRGKMTPERKARQERIAKLKSKNLKDMSLQDLFKEADRIGSKYQDKPETLEENLKSVAKSRSIVRQEKLAGAAQGQIDRLKKLGGAAKNEAEERAKLEKLAIEAPKQVKRFKRAKNAWRS